LDVRRHRLGERSRRNQQCSEDAERAHARYYSLQAARTVCHHPFTLRRLVFPLLVLLLSTFPAGSTEPPPLLLTIDGSPSMGKAEAPVVIVEFSDYQ